MNVHLSWHDASTAVRTDKVVISAHVLLAIDSLLILELVKTLTSAQRTKSRVLLISVALTREENINVLISLVLLTTSEILPQDSVYWIAKMLALTVPQELNTSKC